MTKKKLIPKPYDYEHCQIRMFRDALDIAVQMKPDYRKQDYTKTIEPPCSIEEEDDCGCCDEVAGWTDVIWPDIELLEKIKTMLKKKDKKLAAEIFNTSKKHSLKFLASHVYHNIPLDIKDREWISL